MPESDFTPLLIESILKREGGTVIPMPNPDVTYHFAPDQEGRHVAVVADPGHAQRFMQITEGFRLVGAVAAPPMGAKIEAPAAPEAPAPAAAQPVTAPAPQPDNLPPVASGLAALSDADLRALFEQETGRKPHHKAGRETIISQIEGIRAARAKANQ